MNKWKRNVRLRTVHSVQPICRLTQRESTQIKRNTSSISLTRQQYAALQLIRKIGSSKTREKKQKITTILKKNKYNNVEAGRNSRFLRRHAKAGIIVCAQTRRTRAWEHRLPLAAACLQKFRRLEITKDLFEKSLRGLSRRIFVLLQFEYAATRLCSGCADTGKNIPSSKKKQEKKNIVIDSILLLALHRVRSI